jgi:hypothetical protein
LIDYGTTGVVSMSSGNSATLAASRAIRRSSARDFNISTSAVSFVFHYNTINWRNFNHDSGIGTYYLTIQLADVQ